MEIMIGVIIYILVIALFIAFGRFLKQCDEGIRGMYEKHKDNKL